MLVALRARMVLLRIQLAEVQEVDTQVQALELALHPRGEPVAAPRQ